MRSCTVVIPVFNQAALTARCLETVAGRDPCEVIVVDDASTDTTASVLAGFGGKIRTVSHTQNLGFAVSCNEGAEHANGSYIVFLNNDTVPQPGWLESLVDYAESHPKAAVVGGKLIYPNKIIQHAGVVICRDHYPRHIYAGFPAEHPAVNKSRQYQIVTGACMLIRRQIFNEVGGFDTAFRNGFEDVDLCLRLGQRHYEIHYCAESTVEHLESVSPGRFRHDRENTRLYRERWLERVRPDDLEYYLEDGLIRLCYEGRYPCIIELSPLLATVNDGERSRDLENLVQAGTRELAELQRENTRLRLELGSRRDASPELQYQQLRRRVRQTIQQFVPAGNTVLVASKGDGALLDLPGYRAWHFPQTEHGVYAGYHPADSAEATAALEVLREKGATYLVIPATSLWWLEYYGEFRDHLNASYKDVGAPPDVCAIYHLARQDKPERTEEELRRRLAETEAQLEFSQKKEEWLQSALAAQRHARQMLEASVSANYQETVDRIRGVVRSVIPRGSTVLVVSRGDQELLSLEGQRAWHFPQDDDGKYAGFYPADSTAAISHVQSLIQKGAEYLLLPNTAFWWLEHYRGLQEWLDGVHTSAWRDERCAIYKLSHENQSPAAATPRASVVRATLEGVEGGALLPRPSLATPDILCFPVIDWDFRFQRPQQLMLRFAEAGHRVFYFSHQFRKSGESFVLRNRKASLWEVSLRGPRFSPHEGLLDEAHSEQLGHSLEALRRELGIELAVAMVQSPFWWPLVKRSSGECGWPVVYDCMDHHAGFSSSNPLLIEQEQQLLASANLVVASSSILEEEAVRRSSKRVVLVRNGCDYEHFAKVPHKAVGPRLVVGYYGAISEWFDSDLVGDLAQQQPDWDFIMVGSTISGDIGRLGKLPNVTLAGEQPYAQIPDWVARFDVAILPFKRNRLTEAVNPVKAYEIFAAGKPLVSVPLPEMKALAPLARLASTPEEFKREILAEVSTAEPGSERKRREFALRNTWQERFEALSPEIQKLFALPTSGAPGTAVQNQNCTFL